MVYINKGHVSQIRETLKSVFPEIKFSVRKGGDSSVYVYILKSPYDFSDLPYFDDKGSTEVNHFYVPKCKHRKLLERILKIIKSSSDIKWFHETDSRIDYLHAAFYIQLNVGHYAKGYEIIDFPKPKVPKKKTKGISKSQSSELASDFISSIL